MQYGTGHGSTVQQRFECSRAASGIRLPLCAWHYTATILDGRSVVTYSAYCGIMKPGLKHSTLARHFMLISSCNANFS
jgi:hypothetical protein